MKLVDEVCDPVIEAAHRAHKAALEQKKELYAPLEKAKRIVDAKQLEWYRKEQERLAEERRKAEEEARRKAEEEALRRAEELQKYGLGSMADAALEEVEVIVDRVPLKPESAGGEYVRETWKAEVVDLYALVCAVAEKRVPLNWIEANMTAINAFARSSDGSVVVPGVRFVKEQTLVRR